MQNLWKFCNYLGLYGEGFGGSLAIFKIPLMAVIWTHITELQPRTQSLRSPWPVLGKRATCKDPIWSLKISDFRLNCACLADKHVAQWDAEVLLPLISIMFKNNQNRACNGTCESSSVCQAGAVRNEDSRNEIGRTPCCAFLH